MTMHRSVDDLSVLSRRKELSVAEERRFEVYLGASDDARLFHEIGGDYDRMPVALPGDAALLARVRSRVAERHARHTAREKGRHRVPLLMAFGVLATAVAAAAAGILGHVARSAGDDATPNVAAKPLPSAPAALEKRVFARDREPAATPGAAAEATRSQPDARGGRSEPATRAIPSAETPSLAPLDARALFSRANAERKAGNVGEALLSYEELRRAFPDSPEASLSHVVSGRLLIARGNAERAANQFGAYLARNPNGTLAEEALHGKAEALRALGRSAEERRTWELLLQRFPSSIHAATARERISRDR
jgi:TolA-binding protein